MHWYRQDDELRESDHLVRRERMSAGSEHLNDQLYAVGGPGTRYCDVVSSGHGRASKSSAGLAGSDDTKAALGGRAARHRMISRSRSPRSGRVVSAPRVAPRAAL